MTTPPRTTDGDAATVVSSPGGESLPAALEEHIDEDLLAGTEVGEYRIEGKIGEGGFGTVYQAIHPLIGKKAAIKVLAREYSSNREMVSRFVSEARAVNTIRHTNIIDIFSFGTLDDGRHYFVMELLEGGTLDGFVVNDGPMEPALAITVLRGVARALDAAHDKGIVHRDLKPENIYLTFDEEGRPVAKLLDFGIAKLTGEAKAISGHKTRTGAPIGTPQYMSPEQCVGTEVDERCDVYAFGVLAYELLTGKPPFTHSSFLGLMNLQATAERPLASAANAELGDAYDDAIVSIMAIDADERPPRPGTAWELLASAAREAGVSVDSPMSVPVARRAPSSGLASAATQPVDSLSGDTKHPATRTIGGDEGSSPTAKWPAVAAAVVVLAAGAYVLASGSSAPPAAPVPAATTTATIAATAGAASAASVAPTVSATATAASKIAIRIESAVPGAVAYLDGDELGPVPGSFDVDPLVGKHRLEVKAPNYVDATVEREIHDGDRITLEPKRRIAPGPAPVPRGKVDGDLEDPY
jgi:eukaryotic-like serine/threonine-protein kinase